MNKKLKILATALLLGAMVACNGTNNSSSSQNVSSSSSSSEVVNTSSSSEENVSSSESKDDPVSSSESKDDPVSSESQPSSGEQEKEYEDVTYSINPTNDCETGKKDEDVIVNRFTIHAGTEVRDRTKSFEDENGKMEFTKSIKMGNKTDRVSISVPGNGKLSVIVQNGSSSAPTQTLTLTDPSGNGVNHEFAGKDDGSPLVKLEFDVTEGSWMITRPNSTFDIYYMELTCSVEKSEENGFELVKEGKVKYIEGEAYDASGIILNTVFANGKTEPLPVTNENVTVDTSKYNASVPGEYPITVKYKEYEAVTFNVTVLGVNSITLGRNAIEKLSTNTSSGNGVYFNNTVRQVYALNEEYSDKGLSVIVNASYNGTTENFRVNNNYEVTGFDSSTAGEKELTVTYSYNSKTVTNTFRVNVVDTAPARDASGTVKLKVDPNYGGAIGAVVEGYNQFVTIQQALDYISSRTDIENTDKKVIELAEGTYNEKLEITIPYLTIKGSDSEKTIIEWDSLYGIEDEGGFVHTTDSTQTVAVREQAINCRIEGVTISNFYNSQARFDSRNLAIERALALLVQSDQFVMKDSALLGVQDTLELFTGRQYFENVFISGYTDFIFGTNNTTYFKDCEIHTIDTGKDDSGTGGYITAFKGSNKGSGDYVDYGTIFDECNFTAEEGVTEHATAIGRPWGSYAAVTVMNSTLGDHISLTGFDSSTKNTRYTSMSGVKPNDSTVKYLEYNNTGEGAITEEVVGMRFATDEEAAASKDFATIFGTTNGKVSYANPWDPTSDEVQLDENIYYHFDGKSTLTGTSYVYDQDIAKGSTGTFEDIAIDATNGKVTHRASNGDTQVNPGAKLTLHVEANTTVVVSTYPGYHNYTLNGVATTSDNFEQFYAEETDVVLEAVGTVYLFKITVKPNQEAPGEKTLSALHLKGQQTAFKMGEEFTYDKLEINAEYSDYSLFPVALEDVTVTLDREVTEPGTYVATVSYLGFETTYEVTYVDVNTDPSIFAESTVIDLGTYNGETIQGSVVEWNYVTIDASEGKFRPNGDNTWAQLNANTSLSFKVGPGATITVETYDNSTDYIVTNVDNVVTITATNSIYISKIHVNVPVYFAESKTIDLSATGASIQSTKGTYEGLEVDATNGKFADNGSGWTQVNAGTIITFYAPANSTVSFTAYSSTDNFTVVNDGDKWVITVNANDYLKDITISVPHVFNESTTIDLSATGASIQSTKGTYEGLEVDATNGKFADNGSGWTQVNAGTVITLYAPENATISLNAYSSTDNFTVTYEDGKWTITVNANDYLKDITISVPHVFNESTTIDLSATGANIQNGKGSYEGLEVDATNGKFADNGSGWTQVNAGTVITLYAPENATISVNAYSSTENFVIAYENGKWTITVNANDYLKEISISVPHVFENTTTVNLSATSVNIEGGKGTYEGLEIDATNGKFKDNEGGWVQVNSGTVITLYVNDGATVTVSAYSSADNFAITTENGVCTITCTANDYLNGVTVTY